MFGGYDIARRSSDRVFIFDGTAWTDGPTLPVALNHPAAATLDGRIYLAGGFTASGASNRAWALDPNTRHWYAIASLHRRRGAFALLAVGGRLLAIGGRDGNEQVAPIESYSPATNSWTELTAMPAPRNHVAGYIDRDGRACVAGGRTPTTDASIRCYADTSARWQRLASLPVATSGAAAGTIGGATVIVGGESSGEAQLVSRVQILVAGRWTMLPMVTPRHGIAYGPFHGRLWLCGGATEPGYHAVATCTSIGTTR